MGNIHNMIEEKSLDVEKTVLVGIINSTTRHTTV